MTLRQPSEAFTTVINAVIVTRSTEHRSGYRAKIRALAAKDRGAPEHHHCNRRQQVRVADTDIALSIH